MFPNLVFLFSYFLLGCYGIKSIIKKIFIFVSIDSYLESTTLRFENFASKCFIIFLLCFSIELCLFRFKWSSIYFSYPGYFFFFLQNNVPVAKWMLFCFCAVSSEEIHHQNPPGRGCQSCWNSLETKKFIGENSVT